MAQKIKKKAFGHIEIPLQRVHIELTNICTFNCTFCPKEEMTRPYGYMDTALAKSIIDEIKAEGICEKITFHVMGEPTLHPDFFEILDHAKAKQMQVGLTTNGASLNGAIGKRLMDYDLYQVDVSLQTPDKESFSQRKAGKLSFEEYVDGVLQFFAAYKPVRKESIFKFRFLNTRFCSKEMAEKINHTRINASTSQLHATFNHWAGQVYDLLGVDEATKKRALGKIRKLPGYKWNVVEVYPNVFFETYLLKTWQDASEKSSIRDALAGYCFGMRDHFAILHNGDVVLCCIDFNGRTTVGNLHGSSLRQVLSSPQLGEIVEGFKKFKVVHPYCKKCLGSKSRSGQVLKPVGQILSMNVLKPFFYNQTSLWK